MSCQISKQVRILAIPEIDHPAEPNPYLAVVILNNNCTIDPNGTISEPYARVIRVRGRVNSGQLVERTYDPPQARWSLEGVGPAIAGQANSLWIQLDYEKDGQTHQADAQRMFCAVAPAGGGCGGDPTPPTPTPPTPPPTPTPPQCPPSSWMLADKDPLSVALASPRHLIRETLPRYLAIRLAAKNDRASRCTGGLMMPTIIQLAYDSRLSTPWEAVWVSMNHPESFGTWTLRMESRGSGPMAILTYSNLGEGEVLAPAIYQAIPWNWRSSSVFMPRSDCVTELLASEFRQSGIRVEPA